MLATDDIEDDLAIFGGITRVLDRKGKQVQAQPQPQTATKPLSNFQSNQLPKSPFSYPHLQPQSRQGSSGSSPGASSVELDNPQVHPSLVNYVNREPAMNPGSQNVPPLLGGDGGKFFLNQLESQTSSHPMSQSTNLVDRREYGGGGGMSQGMAGLSPNSGINALGSERYLSTLQAHQRPGPGRGYHNTPLSNANILGDYPSRYGYGNPSSDNTNHMYIESVSMGGRTAEADRGYVPTYTFRNDGMNAMDSTDAIGMDAGWLTFMRDCGIMDVREDR